MSKHRWRISVAVLLGLLLGSSLLMASPQTAQTTTSDSAITNAIEAKLYRDPALKTQDIHVSTQQGVVTLTGTVDTQAQREAADRIASYQPGVAKVIDSMTVTESAPAPAGGANIQYSAPAQPADTSQYSSGETTQYQPLPSTLVVPAGTMLTVRVTQELSSNINRPGDGFNAVLEQPVVVDGWVVARRGQTVQGRVAVAQKGGRVKGVSQLGIDLTELTLVNGQQMPIHTRLLEATAGHSNGRDVAAVGTTTGIGAVIGAIAGEGEGAGIGAAAGAAAGIAGVLLTRGRPTVISPESMLTFRMEAPVTVSTLQGSAAFRPVTQQDYPPNTQQRPERMVMTPPPYYGPPGYYGGYYAGPGYYPGYWGYGPGWRYWGPGFIGIYRFGRDRGWHDDRGYFRGGRGDWHGDHGDRGGWGRGRH